MLPSIILLGLGSWVLTVPCTETLILGCTHLLVINSNRMTATRCGSSLSLCSPRQCPGPWPDENADAKKHHRPAKLSWSVGGAHGKWVTVSESESERVNERVGESVRKSEPNQIDVYNLDREYHTEIPARANTGTVQLSDPSEPVRSSPGSWPHENGDA